MHSPLDQFKVKKLLDIKLLNLDVSFTNSALWMLAAVFLLLVAGIAIRRRGKAVEHLSLHSEQIRPTRFQVAMESLYTLIADMIKSTAGDKALVYFPAIFTIFTFVLLCDVVGMLPGSFAATSHIAVTFALAAMIFIGITTIGIVMHGFYVFKLFVPSGTPLFMAPLMFVLEFIAFLAKPISLSLRLAANITAGHIVLKVIASLAVMSSIYAFMPLSLLVFLTGFELATAILQAYIFTILCCVYLNDVINLH